MANQILKISHLAGTVPDDKMTINRLNSFFEQKRKSFEPLVTEYIKKISEYEDSQVNT